MRPTYRDLARSTGNRPRLHPNGFIQLDVSPSTRLHVWPDKKLKAQATEHVVHDHIFDMLSVVLVGELVNEGFQFVDYSLGDTTLYEARKTTGEETILKPTNRRGDLLMHDRDIVLPGQQYFLPAFHLHSSTARGLTATLMTKTRVHKDARPCVAVPVGVAPDNDYRRDSTDDSVLWSWVEKALR